MNHYFLDKSNLDNDSKKAIIDRLLENKLSALNPFSIMDKGYSISEGSAPSRQDHLSQDRR